jgi:glycosyltransferase involved in cell wall biosynthesis
MEVLAHPDFMYAHHAYFLTGLRQLGYTVRYRRFSAPRLDGSLVFIAGGQRTIVSANDHADVAEGHLEWADVYAKVNLNQLLAPSALAVGPSFGLPLPLSDKAHIAGLTRKWPRTGAWDRLPIDAYFPGLSESDYIFFSAWPWSKHPEVNPPRRAFIEAARASGVRFEGGFAPLRRGPRPGFEDVSAPRKYPLREYLEKIRRSAVVFNNPAVHGCLGWKLGEFLALGKAIISMPLTRELPAPLVHGQHLHVIDGAAHIESALQLLVDDHGYRRHLEANARAWYEEWLAPAKVMERVLLTVPSTPESRCF